MAVVGDAVNGTEGGRGQQHPAVVRGTPRRTGAPASAGCRRQADPASVAPCCFGQPWASGPRLRWPVLAGVLDLPVEWERRVWRNLFVRDGTSTGQSGKVCRSSGPLQNLEHVSSIVCTGLRCRANGASTDSTVTATAPHTHPSRAGSRLASVPHSACRPLCSCSSPPPHILLFRPECRAGAPA